MRYLCLQDNDVDGNIPIFIELRRINQERDLNSLIIEQLKNIGLGEFDSDSVLDVLLISGKSRLFLDGYDEISREFSLQVKSDIKNLLAKYEKLQILITSRPGAISQHLKDSININQFDIAPISSAEYEGFFKKIGVDQNTRDRLLSAISRSKNQIKVLLSTPLMLTLLVITYGRQQDLPDSLPDFYDSIFNVLASTHDGTKPGYIRQKATPLSNNDLEKLFSTFSFISKFDFRRNSLNHRQFEEALEKSKKITNLKCTDEGFRTDITETVCVMVNDGLEIAFIHKSIQEYYAARFLHTLENKDQVQRILEKISNSGIFEWNNEFQFLEDFNDRLYQNIIGIPHAQKIINELRIKNKKNPIISWTKLKKFIDNLNIGVTIYQTSKRIAGVSYGLNPQKFNSNRYYLNLAAILSRSVVENIDLNSAPLLLKDEVSVVGLTKLAEDFDSIKLDLIRVANKYCEDLERKTNLMMERQRAQDEGIMSILA